MDENKISDSHNENTLKRIIISYVFDVWATLWRSLLFLVVATFIAYLLNPDPAPGLGSGMAIIGVLVMLVMLFFPITFIYYRYQYHKGKTSNTYWIIAKLVFDLLALIALILGIIIAFSLFFKIPGSQTGII